MRFQVLGNSDPILGVVFSGKRLPREVIFVYRVIAGETSRTFTINIYHCLSRFDVFLQFLILLRRDPETEHRDRKFPERLDHERIKERIDIFVIKLFLFVDRSGIQDFVRSATKQTRQGVKEPKKITVSRVIIQARVSKETDPLAIQYASAKCVRFPKITGVLIEVRPYVAKIVGARIFALSLAKKFEEIVVRRQIFNGRELQIQQIYMMPV